MGERLGGAELGPADLLPFPEFVLAGVEGMVMLEVSIVRAGSKGGRTFSGSAKRIVELASVD